MINGETIKGEGASRSRQIFAADVLGQKINPTLTCITKTPKTIRRQTTLIMLPDWQTLWSVCRKLVVNT